MTDDLGMRPIEAEVVGGVDGEEGGGVTPLKAARRHCVDCCNGSFKEVDLCPAKGCSLWAFRFGRRPDDDAKADQAWITLHPAEDGISGADFHGKGASALKAIRRRCVDCSGGSRQEVQGCKSTACDLWQFRLGKNPNFGSMSDDTRAKIGLPAKRAA